MALNSSEWLEISDPDIPQQLVDQVIPDINSIEYSNTTPTLVDSPGNEVKLKTDTIIQPPRTIKAGSEFPAGKMLPFDITVASTSKIDKNNVPKGTTIPKGSVLSQKLQLTKGTFIPKGTSFPMLVKVKDLNEDKYKLKANTPAPENYVLRKDIEIPAGLPFNQESQAINNSYKFEKDILSPIVINQNITIPKDTVFPIDLPDHGITANIPTSNAISCPNGISIPDGTKFPAGYTLPINIINKEDINITTQTTIYKDTTLKHTNLTESTSNIDNDPSIQQLINEPLPSFLEGYFNPTKSVISELSQSSIYSDDQKNKIEKFYNDIRTNSKQEGPSNYALALLTKRLLEGLKSNKGLSQTHHSKIDDHIELIQKDIDYYNENSVSSPKKIENLGYKIDRQEDISTPEKQGEIQFVTQKIRQAISTSMDEITVKSKRTSNLEELDNIDKKGSEIAKQSADHLYSRLNQIYQEMRSSKIEFEQSHSPKRRKITRALRRFDNLNFKDKFKITAAVTVGGAVIGGLAPGIAAVTGATALGGAAFFASSHKYTKRASRFFRSNPFRSTTTRNAVIIEDQVRNLADEQADRTNLFTKQLAENLDKTKTKITREFENRLNTDPYKAKLDDFKNQLNSPTTTDKESQEITKLYKAYVVQIIAEITEEIYTEQIEALTITRSNRLKHRLTDFASAAIVSPVVTQGLVYMSRLF